MSGQRHQILERIDPVELAAVDQTHEEVARFGAVDGFIRQRRFRRRSLGLTFEALDPIFHECRDCGPKV